MRASILLAGLAATVSAAACTSENAVQRKEWGDMSNNERRSYIDGVQCLMQKPTRFRCGQVPASTSLWSDFAAVHVNLTTSIHISGIFLSWHRHYLWLLEQELHDLCDYPKYLGPYVVGVGQELPHGTGGGCVTTGPFANTSVNLGPFSFSLIFTGLPSTWSTANPRCLTRDLNDYGIENYDTTALVNQILSADNITEVQTLVNSKNVGTTSRGLHGGGHYAVGGIMFDFFASPQDPALYLHHGNLDRIWNEWQLLDPGNRRYQYNGTSTILNTNATPNVRNSTTIDFYVLGGSTTLEQVADPLAGQYCYKYV